MITVERNDINFFSDLIRDLDFAKKKVFINMFVWRNDEIGERILDSLLGLAPKGIEIVIRKDRCGVLFEKSEESGESLFHDNISFIEKIKINCLKKFYKNEIIPYEKASDVSEKLNKLKEFPNVKIDTGYYYDHSKYIIVDDEIMFVGGINFENKENFIDKNRRLYQDYMIRIEDKRLIDSFNRKVCPYLVANDLLSKKISALQCAYLRVINNAKDEIYVVSPYISYDEYILSKLYLKALSGTKIKIMVPGDANFMNDVTKKSLSYLQEKNNKNIEIYFSNKMCHTKCIFSENSVTIGSCNLTKNSFRKMNELNFMCSSKSEAGQKIITEIKKDFAKERVHSGKITYSSIRALIENLYA